MTKNDIFSAFYDWITTNTGLTCIASRQDAPRPELPFISLLVVNAGARVGSQDAIEYNEDEDKHYQAGLRTTNISINMFGGDANEVLSNLRDTLDSPNGIDFFKQKGLSHIDENGPNDLTEIENTSYPERSQLGLTFMYAINKELDIESIESATFEGEIESENSTDEDEITI